MGKNSESNDVFQFPTFTLEELLINIRLVLQDVYNKHSKDYDSDLLFIADHALALYVFLHFKSSKL